MCALASRRICAVFSAFVLYTLSMTCYCFLSTSNHSSTSSNSSQSQAAPCLHPWQRSKNLSSCCSTKQVCALFRPLALPATPTTCCHLHPSISSTCLVGSQPTYLTCVFCTPPLLACPGSGVGSPFHDQVVGVVRQTAASPVRASAIGGASGSVSRASSVAPPERDSPSPSIVVQQALVRAHIVVLSCTHVTG